MSYAWLLIGLVPLVSYVLIDLFAGAKAGIITAMAMGLGFLGLYYVKFGSWDVSIVVEAVLILGLGGVSLKLDDPKFFKLQPVIVGVVLALFLTWFQVFDEPYLVKMSDRMMRMMPELQDNLNGPLFRHLMELMSWQLIVLFLVHSALVAYAALKMKNLGWILMRIAIYPLVFILVIANVLVGA